MIDRRDGVLIRPAALFDGDDLIELRREFSFEDPDVRRHGFAATGGPLTWRAG